MDKWEMVIAGKSHIAKAINTFEAVLYRHIPTGKYHWYFVNLGYFNQEAVSEIEVAEMIRFKEDRLALWNSATVNR